MASEGFSRKGTLLKESSRST